MTFTSILAFSARGAGCIPATRRREEAMRCTKAWPSSLASPQLPKHQPRTLPKVWSRASTLPITRGRRLYSYVLRWESTLCKTPHFQWIYGKLNQIYEKLRSDQMDPKSALGGPKPISRTGGSLLKNWSYTSNQCIYFSILLYWRPHLAKTLFILHKYIKCALL